MMEYAFANQKMPPAGVMPLNRPPEPELGKIKHAAERVAKARSDIELFVERFNGGVEDGAGPSTDERVSGYRNDLGSLLEQIERLEKVVSQLGNIG